MMLLQSGADLRPRKIRRIRAAIRADRYDNDLKLSIALDRMLAEEIGPHMPEPRLRING